LEDHSRVFKRISIEEAKTLIESYPELTIADIRDSKSYNLSNIKKSINLNNDNIKQFLRETRKETPLLIYCYHGVNSQEAANYFLREGFREVYSLDGGFSEFSKYK
jgi:thiosulfate sulfurtransferase